MNLQLLPEIVTHTSEFLRVAEYISYECYLYAILLFNYFRVCKNCMLILLYFVQSKYAKNSPEEIPSIGHSVLDFSFVSMYTEFLSDLYKNSK